MARGLEGREPQEAARLAVSEPEVRAAGGVVRRRGPGGGWLAAIVHRPRYDDWTFPKGKREADEPDIDTARREVEEETGLTCRLGPEIGETRYRDSRGRSKVVRYWLMEPDNIEVTNIPNREVDELRWCTDDEADELLTYEHDRELLHGVERLYP